jgi:hypothetical protein
MIRESNDAAESAHVGSLGVREDHPFGAGQSLLLLPLSALFRSTSCSIAHLGKTQTDLLSSG